MFTGLWNDLSHAARSLANAPAFTIVCVVTLGIGMVPVIAIPYGARVFRMPPPGLPTDGLVELSTIPKGARPAKAAWSYPDFLDLRGADTGIALVGWTKAPSEITPREPGETKTNADTMFVSADYFRVMEVALARGPGFDPDVDDAPTAKPVVVLGYEFWQNRLAADPDIVGKTLTLDDTPHVVVGIAPDGFTGHMALQGASLFVPLQRHPLLRAGNKTETDVRSDRSREWVYIHGRLSRGVPLAQANAAVSSLTSRLATQFADTNALRAGIVEAYDAFGNVDRPQFLIAQAVALTLTGTVLVVVCLNISGMMQVRSAVRERELSIRQAVGASRFRLARYLLSEALILAGAGGALASVVLFNIPALLAWMADRPLPLPFEQALRLNMPTVAISVGMCLFASLVFGWLPATRFSRPVIISSLKDDAGSGGFRVGRVHRTTAALQVAIAVPLIVMSGIALERVRATATSDLGFDSDVLYAAPLQLEAGAIESTGFKIRTVRGNLQNASGVAAATVTDGLPLDFKYRLTRVSLPVDPGTAPTLRPVQVTRVGDGYLETMGISLLRGRGFTADDRAGAESVTIISKALADVLFPNGGATAAIGQQLMFGADEQTRQSLTIVGVTGDFPTAQMSTERPQLLLPLAQHPAESLFLVARAAPGEPPAKLTAALENAVRELGPDVDREVTTGDGVSYATIVTGVWLRQNSVSDFLTQSAVAGGAGSVILVLAALGIYGVVGLMVTTRTREIAVRAALGATRRQVIRMILFDVLRLVTPGVVVGVVLTAALNRVNAENMGISLSGIEPVAYIAGAAVAILVAMIASLAPARRAASVQPMVAMRSL
jgi:putative ABC transport system permease protein